MMLHLPLAFLFCCAAFVAGSSLSKQRVETCDVIIAGGSLASLAAAVSAANYSSTLNVCFLEPTDWPGGQLTASSVPAIDFGPFNRKPANIAQPFASFLFGQFMPDKVNPGHCWVTLPLKLSHSSNSEPQLSGINQVLPPTRRQRTFRKPTPLLLPQPEDLFDDVDRCHTLQGKHNHWRHRCAARSQGRKFRMGNADVQVTSTALQQQLPPLFSTLIASSQLQDWYLPESSHLFLKSVIELELSSSGVIVEATECRPSHIFPVSP